MSLDIQKKKPLSPRSRANKLGLQSSRFDYKEMGKTAEEEIKYIKRKHRSEIKVLLFGFRKINGESTNTIKPMLHNYYLIALMKQIESIVAKYLSMIL